MGVKKKYIKVMRGSLVGVFVVAVGGLAVFTTEHVVGEMFDRYKLQIEKSLSEKIGHRLLIGEYQGFRPWGISIGPTNFSEGYKDESTGNIDNLNVQFAPISSLLTRRPVLILTASGADFNLRRNKNGSYWNFGPSGEGPAPNLELRFRFHENSKVFLEPSNIEIKGMARLDLNLRDSRVKGNFQLNVPRKGSLNLKASGNWNKLDFQTEASLKNFRLSSLDGILPKRFNFKTKGKADGSFQLGINNGAVNCLGDLVVSDLTVVGGALKDSLSSKKSSIACKDNLVQLPLAQWEYGLWTAAINGKLPLTNPKDLNLSISTLISHKDDLSTSLEIDASLPLLVKKQGFGTGDLLANFDVDSFSLNTLSDLSPNSLAGNLSANGTVKGPLSDLETSFSFSLKNPQFTNLRLQEEWRGQFVGSAGGGGKLQMNSEKAAIPSTISAQLRNDWSLNDLIVRRLGGQIAVTRNTESFDWIAKNFRLDRIEIAIPPEKSFKRIFGKLSGKGRFGFKPLFANGQINLGYPRLIGFKLKEAQLEGSYSERNYSLKGNLFPLDAGQISLTADGRVNGSLWTKTELKKVSPSWIFNTALQLPKINKETPIPNGRAEDLGVIKINPVEGSLDSQLGEWIRSVIAVSQSRQLQKNQEIINPDDLRGYIDAVIEVEGPKLSELNIDLNASGKLWAADNEKTSEIDVQTFTATIKGPLQIGQGEFSFMNIPFSLLSLLTPSPVGLTGMFGISGKYSLGKRKPEITADLVFNEVAIGSESLVLQRGKISFADSTLSLDLVIQNPASSQPLTLIGQVPFSSSSPIDLRIESHGDGIAFLDEFSEGTVDWKSGSADLILLIRGTIEDPKANGFLVLNDGEIAVNQKSITDINGTIVFDFDRVEVQRLEAIIEESGILKGSGDIALLKPSNAENKPLTLTLENFQLKSSFSDIQLSSNLSLRGSLVKPILGGEVTIKEGSISTERSSGRRKKDSKSREFNKASLPYKSKLLPEQKWNRKTPLVLFIGDKNAPTSKLIQSSIPKGFSSITFDNLRLNLGPDLRIVSQPVTSFEVDGFLLLNGGFDETIKATGLVRLLDGRVNLFTTTFQLDKREQNVAIFVPSMGLIPYIDVKLTSRVPDTVRNPSDLTSSSDFVTNGSGSFGIGGSRFVKVEVMASGPADRLQENYQLRSTPPIPENELLGLIGGNSLANLFKGGDSTVFADVLTRSFVAPVLGNISGAFSERLQISLYPAYVSAPEIETEIIDNQSNTSTANSTNEESGQLSSQQAWVTEMGIDLTDRINFSVQTTPNREDIPSQGNLTYQLNQNFGLKGSFDQNGNWHSQLEIFLRY